MRRRILLVASKTGYQVKEFHGAAERLGVDLVLATDRCHVLENPWGDSAIALPFSDSSFEVPLGDPEIEVLRARGPFEGILAVGDGPALIAARCAERLGLRFHPSQAVMAANDKLLTRERFRAAGLNVPDFRMAGDSAKQQYPCVLKPLHSSASRGVIRADTPEEFKAALARIRKMKTGTPRELAGKKPRIAGGAENWGHPDFTERPVVLRETEGVPNFPFEPDRLLPVPAFGAAEHAEDVLVEDFIPGREFALEGIVNAGNLQTLAIFDKPDPLDGPFFEETIYVTPSREAMPVQGAIREAAQQAVTALGLEAGPVHAEMRVNDRGVWMLEAAARPIGGLCSRVLRFEGGMNLEDLLLRQALGEDVAHAALTRGAHGVMMIPIPKAGIYSGVEGLEQARETADIESVEITAKAGHRLEPVPEGATYLGFLFARAPSAERVERALRQAHARLRFRFTSALSVIRPSVIR